MKKLIFVLLVAFVAFAASAQTIGTPIAFVQDTTTDAETEYLVLASPVALNNNYVIGLTITPVNLSGTATVVASIETSVDNTVWHSYGTATTVNNAGTVANYSWMLTDYPFKYIRLKCISTGTGATKLNGKLIIKRPQ